MDESKPRSPRSRVAKGTTRKPTTSPAAKPNPSAHVIDLRQGGNVAPAKPQPPIRRPAAANMDMAPRKKSTPLPPEESELAPQPAPRTRPAAPVPAPNPINHLDAEPIDTYSAGQEYDLVSTRRFWPAFWRFLFLLILLGLIIAGSLFLYLGYFRNG